MYLQNKYTKWYFNIVNNAKSRQLPKSFYVEKHHIVPVALGGSDCSNNLVKLTAKEHFICHLLLTKMLKGNAKHKMIYAANRMLSASKYHQRYKVTSTTYQILKEKFSKAKSADQKGVPQSPESNKKRSESLKGRTTYVRTPEIIEKIKATKKSNPQTPWNKGKTSLLKGKTYEEIYGKEKADNIKRQKSKSLSGRPKAEKTKKIWSENRKGKNTLSNNSNAQPVILHGKKYGSKKEACIELNISLYHLNKILNNV